MQRADRTEGQRLSPFEFALDFLGIWYLRTGKDRQFDLEVSQRDLNQIQRTA